MGHNKIKILTDSTNDLSKEIIENMSIGVMPLYVNFDEEQYKDGINLQEPELYKKVDKFGKLPKTAAPSVGDFIEFFKPYVDEGYDILFLPVSFQMSSCGQNAIIAAEEFKNSKIYVVDSANLSTGIGLQLCAAYDMVQKGLSIEEIVENLKEISDKVKTAFTIETLDYLYKGGRCNALQALLSSMLNIKPIIKVKEGKMIVGAKIRGKKKKALDYMIDEALQYKDKMLYNRLFITHTSGSEDEAIYIKEILEKELKDINIYITNAGCVIASHCGRKTIGILFIAD